MTSEARDRRSAPTPSPKEPHATPDARRAEAPAPSVGLSFSLPFFVAALLAGLVGHFLAGAIGLVAVIVASVLAGLAAGFLPETAGARRALEETLARERERATLAVDHLEKSRRHAELAVVQFREGKDPLTEVPELRVGPMRELLEAARESTTQPVLSRLSMSEEELVATDGEPLPVPWPAGVEEMPATRAVEAAPEPVPAGNTPEASDEPERRLDPPARDGRSPFDSAARAGILRELNALIAGLGELATGLGSSSGGSGAAQGRTPAQLVDAVVHTAADGIEDLAAGLMRANELAGVAERVTNKATLLALNAALEATRSGSEAFAAIAEETRRLAEFSREATDTISRLSSEIEYKVGETITAIHATSEDAKSAVATFQASPGGAAAPIPTAAVEALLRRAQELKRRLLAEAA